LQLCFLANQIDVLEVNCELIEEDFYSLFVEKLGQSVAKLPPRNKPDEWAMKSYLNEWHEFNAITDPDACIVSCDGSMGTSVFSGGLEALVVRAVAHIRPKNGKMVSIPNVEVPIDYDLGGNAIFMKTVELETLAQAIEKASANSGKVFAVYDGNLSLFLPSRYIQNIQALAKDFERHVKALTRCFKLVSAGRLELVGISKDSKVTYLRARLIIDALLRSRPDLTEMMRRAQRSLKLITKRLDEILDSEGANSSLRPYLNELKQPISDEGLYGELATEAGYTTPLLLGPQTRFAFYFASKTQQPTDWWKSPFREMLGRNVELEGLRASLDELYSQPPTAISYWKNRPNPSTYRLDIPSALLGQEMRTGDMNENRLGDETAIKLIGDIIAKLNWLSRVENAISPLTEVDAVVRLDRRLYNSSYEPLIMDELKRKGHNVRLTKRRIRDYVQRGY